MTFWIHFLAVATVFGVCLGGFTPLDCCQREKSEIKTPDRCVHSGIFKSSSVCFLHNGLKIDRSDYYQCAPCGSTWCMARLLCPQPCRKYLGADKKCDCWNYYNAGSRICNNLPPPGLEDCPDSSATSTTSGSQTSEKGSTGGASTTPNPFDSTTPAPSSSKSVSTTLSTSDGTSLATSSSKSVTTTLSSSDSTSPATSTSA